MTSTEPIVINHPAEQWIGNLNGTLAGNLYVEIKQDSGQQTLRFRAFINEEVIDVSGPLLVEGERRYSKLDGVAPDGSPLVITIWFDSVASDFAAGRWEGSKGHGGIFSLRAAPTNERGPTNVELSSQIIMREGKLPRVTLTHPELAALMKKLKSLISTPNDVIVSAKINGNTITALGSDFLQRKTLPREINELRMSLSEAKSFTPKTISIALLNDLGPNFSVSSDDEAWVNGAWLSVQHYMRQHYTWFDDIFQKYGLSLNFFVLLFALVLSPNLPTFPRIVFIALVVLGLVVYKLIHDRFNRVRIYPLSQTREPLVDINKVMSRVIAAGLLAIGAYLFNFLQASGLSRLTDWLAAVVN